MPEDHSYEGVLLRQFMEHLYRDLDIEPCGGCKYHQYDLWCEKYQRPPYWFQEDDWPTQRCVRARSWEE